MVLVSNISCNGLGHGDRWDSVQVGEKTELHDGCGCGGLLVIKKEIALLLSFLQVPQFRVQSGEVPPIAIIGTAIEELFVRAKLLDSTVSHDVNSVAVDNPTHTTS